GRVRALAVPPRGRRWRRRGFSWRCRGLVSLVVVLVAKAVAHRLGAALRLGAGPVSRVRQLAVAPFFVVEEAISLGAVWPLAIRNGASLLAAALRLSRPFGELALSCFGHICSFVGKRRLGGSQSATKYRSA